MKKVTKGCGGVGVGGVSDWGGVPKIGQFKFYPKIDGTIEFGMKSYTSMPIFKFLGDPSEAVGGVRWRGVPGVLGLAIIYIRFNRIFKHTLIVYQMGFG